MKKNPRQCILQTFWMSRRCRDNCYTGWCLYNQLLAHSGEWLCWCHSVKPFSPPAYLSMPSTSAYLHTCSQVTITTLYHTVKVSMRG